MLMALTRNAAYSLVIRLPSGFLKGEYDDQLQWPFHGKIASRTSRPEYRMISHRGGTMECIMHYGDNTPDRYAQRVSQLAMKVLAGVNPSLSAPF